MYGLERKTYGIYYRRRRCRQGMWACDISALIGWLIDYVIRHSSWGIDWSRRMAWTQNRVQATWKLKPPQTILGGFNFRLQVYSKVDYKINSSLPISCSYTTIFYPTTVGFNQNAMQCLSFIGSITHWCCRHSAAWTWSSQTYSTGERRVFSATTKYSINSLQQIISSPSQSTMPKSQESSIQMVISAYNLKKKKKRTS